LMHRTGRRKSPDYLALIGRREERRDYLQEEEGRQGFKVKRTRLTYQATRKRKKEKKISIEKKRGAKVRH